MIIVYILLSAISALGLVYLFETGWQNRPPCVANEWPKGRAMRFIWAVAAILAVVFHMAFGVLFVITALPICLAHLTLVDQNPTRAIAVHDVFRQVSTSARSAFRRFLDRTRLGPRW
jgi:hypothetical protein